MKETAGEVKVDWAVVGITTKRVLRLKGTVEQTQQGVIKGLSGV